MVVLARPWATGQGTQGRGCLAEGATQKVLQHLHLIAPAAGLMHKAAFHVLWMCGSQGSHARSLPAWDTSLTGVSDLVTLGCCSQHIFVNHI